MLGPPASLVSRAATGANINQHQEQLGNNRKTHSISRQLGCRWVDWLTTSAQYELLCCCYAAACAGCVKQLPDSFRGLVLQPDLSSGGGSDAEQRSWHATASFDRVMVWNHDTTPAVTDWHVRCIDWLSLADQVGALMMSCCYAASLHALMC